MKAGGKRQRTEREVFSKRNPGAVILTHREKRKRIRLFFKSVKRKNNRRKRYLTAALAAAVILYLLVIGVLRDGFFLFREEKMAVYIREQEGQPDCRDVFRIIFSPESGELIFSHEKVQGGDS